MFPHRPPHQQYAIVGIVGLLVVGMAAIGANHLRQPAPIAITPLPANAPAPTSEAPTKALGQIVVHVAGAVKKPAVVRIGPDDRVQDAIHLAGGPTADADLEKINLAAKLEDGAQLLVPRKEENAPLLIPRGAIPPQIEAEAMRIEPAPRRYSAKPKPVEGDASLSSSNLTPLRYPAKRRSDLEPASAAGLVYLNSATLAQLDTLPGVGPSTAQKILEYRRMHGPFSSVDELLGVSGIGEKKLAKMRSRLSL